ncbi:MAG: tetratricopeptide repeat protein, partial [Bryobacteraceae bacterium]
MDRRLIQVETDQVGDRAAAAETESRALSRRLYSLAAVVALVLFSAAVGCRGPATRSPDSQYADAERERQQGSLDRAQREAVAGFEAFRNTTPEWHWRFRLLAASVYLARNSPQDSLSYLTPSAGDPPVPTALEARRQMHLFDAYHRMQQPAEARRHLDEAARSGVPELASRIALRRGYVGATYEESDAAFRGALDQAVQGNDVFTQITALNDLGYLRLTHERFDEALRLFERALGAAQGQGPLRIRGIILGNLGWCYYRLGQSDRALELLTEADRVAERSADWGSRYRWLNNIGNIYA